MGAFHDVTNMIRKYGIVPEGVYDGLNYGEEKHVHGEMDRVLKQHVDAVVENKNKKVDHCFGMNQLKQPLILIWVKYPKNLNTKAKNTPL